MCSINHLLDGLISALLLQVFSMVYETKNLPRNLSKVSPWVAAKDIKVAYIRSHFKNSLEKYMMENRPKRLILSVYIILQKM